MKKLTIITFILLLLIIPTIFAFTGGNASADRNTNPGGILLLLTCNGNIQSNDDGTYSCDLNGINDANVKVPALVVIVIILSLIWWFNKQKK